MDAKPGNKLTKDGETYWKLIRYLKVVKETNTADKVKYYQGKGFLATPEIQSELVRLRGASVKRGVGASTGKAKGGKKALFTAAGRLKAIHKAKLKGTI